MKSVILKVEGMNCNGCAERIRSTVAAEPGVQTAVVSFEDGNARVLYDPQAIEENRLVEAIRRLGFRVVDRTPT
ncbi:MAG: heavy-metal-associated domain-containing protein [Betaproteobacteria bacterium]